MKTRMHFKILANIIFLFLAFLCPLMHLYAQTIAVAKIKKLPILAGQWQMVGQTKAGKKTELKSNFIIEFSPNATYLLMEKKPIQGNLGNGQTQYEFKIIDKGKWQLINNESNLILKNYNFTTNRKNENELANIISFKMNDKNKKNFTVKKLEGKDTIECFYKKISNQYTFMANVK